MNFFFLRVIISISLIISVNCLDSQVQPCLSRSLEQVFNQNESKPFDCSLLSSDIQITLALHFTFCHLNSTGINPNSICSLTLINNHRQDCLKNLTQNSFGYLTYTNFLPHIQSICYAIQNQQWHQQMNKRVSQLNQHSNQLEDETKQLLIEQENMQTNLDQALIVNQHSMDDALSIDRFLQVAQTDVEELRGHLYVKDKAQIELIQQILETLFNIQTSLFTDAFGLTSYVFYAIALIGIHLLTIPERTSDSKFWLILLWLCLIGFERYMLLFSSYSQLVLYDILWRFRQLWFLISCLTLIYVSVRYRNYSKENQQLIDEIDRKHKELEIAARKCLRAIDQLDMSDCSFETDNTSNNSTDDDEDI